MTTTLCKKTEDDSAIISLLDIKYAISNYQNKEFIVSSIWGVKADFWLGYRPTTATWSCWLQRYVALTLRQTAFANTFETGSKDLQLLQPPTAVPDVPMSIHQEKLMGHRGMNLWFRALPPVTPNRRAARERVQQAGIGGGTGVDEWKDSKWCWKVWVIGICSPEMLICNIVFR